MTDLHVDVARPIAGRPMIIERELPAYDAVRIEHRVVPGDLATVFAAARRADFMRAWHDHTSVRVLFGARAAAERAVATLRGRPAPAPEEVEQLRLADLPAEGDWVLLGEDPPHEIAFGVVGRFWTGETDWEHIDAREFATFSKPGYARIAANLSLRPYGRERVLVSYECRTQATDAGSRQAFLRYWRPLAPFIGVVLRAMLSTVEDELRSPGDVSEP